MTKRALKLTDTKTWKIFDVSVSRSTSTRLQKLAEVHVKSFLRISSAKLAEHDLELLRQTEDDTDLVSEFEYRGDAAPIHVVSHRFGWWVKVRHDNQRALGKIIASIYPAGFSAKFRRIFIDAAALKCDWINFDRDA
jgi:hypothetical protein